MALLRSYGFSKDIPYKVWELFKKANELGTQLDYTLEIIDAAMDGKVNFEKEFNLKAYINAINHSRQLENYRRAKKVKRINVNWGEPYDDENSVSEEIISGYVEQTDEYEKLVDDDEVLFAVSEINRMSADILIQNHLEIHTCITQALKGMPESIKLIQDLVADNPYAGELLQIILASGYSYEDLFSRKRG